MGSEAGGKESLEQTHAHAPAQSHEPIPREHPERTGDGEHGHAHEKLYEESASPVSVDAPFIQGANLLGGLFPDMGNGVGIGSEVWRRHQARQIIREFLRVVPRTEPEASITFIRPDGAPRLLTRGELTAAVDRLRPRQRQIVRLAIEERWPRARVCDHLKHISIKTYERDYAEALDLLIHI